MKLIEAWKEKSITFLRLRVFEITVKKIHVELPSTKEGYVVYHYIIKQAILNAKKNKKESKSETDGIGSFYVLGLNNSVGPPF